MDDVLQGGEVFGRRPEVQQRDLVQHLLIPQDLEQHRRIFRQRCRGGCGGVAVSIGAAAVAGPAGPPSCHGAGVAFPGRARLHLGVRASGCDSRLASGLRVPELDGGLPLGEGHVRVCVLLELHRCREPLLGGGARASAFPESLPARVLRRRWLCLWFGFWRGLARRGRPPRGLRRGGGGPVAADDRGDWVRLPPLLAAAVAVPAASPVPVLAEQAAAAAGARPA
mmetsp:Transcript_4661/g.11297  ORF Transcript_4661/g.11297 Transcript_4661/m.11297 type:complete len:225 (+) Transcript_4661:708-1382(+)